jgi:FixJ family two-component response regulator
MPDMDGLEVQRQLAQRDSHLPIIFITAHGDVSTCASAFRSGAFHFLEKPVDDALLIDVIEEAVAFESNRLRLDAPHDFAGLAGELTPSEKEVMDMLIAGKSLKEIAAARDVTFQTASRHRLSILEKMGVDGDVALVRMATEWAYLQRRPQDA